MSDKVRNILFIAFITLALVSLVVFSVKKSDDPLRMIFRWALTAIVVPFMFLKVLPMVFEDPSTALLLTAVCGSVMAVTWRRALASIIANPIGNLFDGGSDAL